MAAPVTVEIIMPKDLEEIQKNIQNIPPWLPKFIETNFKTLGTKVAYIMQRVLEPVKFRGELAANIKVQIIPNKLEMHIGSTAKHAPYVYFGTRPHWAPIAPLKEWAKVKLGNEQAAYGIQRNIANYGTNRGYSKKGLKGAWQSKWGIGFDYLKVTVERGDFQSNLDNTMKRMGINLAAKAVIGTTFQEGKAE